MTRRSVQRKPPTTNVSTPAVPDALAELLHRVETCCGRAAGVVNAAARLVAGDELGLQHEDVPTVYTIALEHVAGDPEGLADRALRARTGGAA